MLRSERKIKLNKANNLKSSMAMKLKHKPTGNFLKHYYYKVYVYKLYYLCV